MSQQMSHFPNQLSTNCIMSYLELIKLTTGMGCWEHAAFSGIGSATLAAYKTQAEMGSITFKAI